MRSEACNESDADAGSLSLSLSLSVSASRLLPPLSLLLRPPRLVWLSLLPLPLPAPLFIPLERLILSLLLPDDGVDAMLARMTSVREERVCV